MIQADSVHSTPPTNTSARHSRRSILGAIAGSAAAAGGIAAAEGINLSANTINVLAPKTPSKEITPSQGIEGDPIFAVIERHRRACIEHTEAVHINMDFEEIGMTGAKLEKYNSLVAETDAAYDRLDDVGCDFINARPTTLAGILALCRYIVPLFKEGDAPDCRHTSCTTTTPRRPRPKRFAM